MLRMIAADYDGTLLPKGKEALSSAFFNKVHQLCGRGMVFAVVSGRPYHQLKELFRPVSQDVVLIANDGAQTMYRNCVLQKKPIDASVCKQLCRFGLGEGMTPLACLREKTASVKKEQLELPFFLSSDVFKLVFVRNGKSVTDLAVAAEQLKLRNCYEDETYIEFCRADATKGTATDALMKKFDITIAQTAAFGDGLNDLPMLHCASQRFVMKDAPKELQAYATVILEDARAYILNEL